MEYTTLGRTGLRVSVAGLGTGGFSRVGIQKSEDHAVGIIRQAIEGLPEGPIVGKVPRLIKPPAGETYHAVESPKGELGFYIVSDGNGSAYRARTRPPSYIHFAVFPYLIQGHQISDVVAVLGSLNIIAAELDR